MTKKMPLKLRPADASDPLVAKALQILERDLCERAGLETIHVTEEADIVLRVDRTIPTEGYRVSPEDGGLCIAGGDAAGLFYGMGRFLHESIRGDGTFSACEGIPLSVPDCRIRGMYFAHNFHNWYRSAPLEDLVRYVEELALWGLNAIVFPCDTNPQCPLDEILGVMVPKQLGVIEAARTCGIQVGLIFVANTLSDVPSDAIAAVPVPDSDPPRRGQKGNRVCPSHPEAAALLAERFDRMLEVYRDTGVDFVVSFPYDEGGCGCQRCRPWGGNGYVKASKLLSCKAKAKYPGCRFIACTWCFDVLDEPEGEYAGLDEAIRKDTAWCDAVMCDSHGDFPTWPLANGAPGGLPMISFSEISMWGRWPWGGYGANPLPSRVARIWNQASHLLDGGFPYSEGRFEDINKVACLSLFWDKDADWREILGSYIRYEFGAAAVDDVLAAILVMEETYPPDQLTVEKTTRALALLEGVAENLPLRVLNSWRWRILYLRASIDAETAAHPSRTGIVSERQKACFDELIRLYCAEHAEPSVTPPRGAC